MDRAHQYEVLEHHTGQQRYWHSTARFNLAHPGRRAGKSEIAKRRLVRRAVLGVDRREPRYAFAAPVFRQAKAIAWNDLKRMVPKAAMRGKPSESTLTIPLWHGGELFVLGMDSPARIEGPPLDGIVLDEYANMKPGIWSDHVRPALSTKNRLGWADFIGVPEGRNHYYDLAQTARMLQDDPESGWMLHHWPSAEVLDASEIEDAQRDLDELTFLQEYGGEFVTFAGRAYYGYGDYSRAKLRQLYNPDAPLIVCFDFNVEPGVAVICQELPLPIEGNPVGTAVMGEVYIPRNSTTPAVCRKVLEDWGEHRGLVFAYGDATGGARGTAKTEGSDWELIQRWLRNGGDGLVGFGGQRVHLRVFQANPAERARVNAVNSRLRNSAGEVRMMIDPAHAPHVIKDLEGVVLLTGGSGEIDKKRYPLLSHISDALGYYVEAEFPVRSRTWAKVRTAF